MGVLRDLASGLLVVLGSAVILFIIAFVALPLFAERVLVDHLILRPERERENGAPGPGALD